MPQYQDPAAADALRYLRGRTDALQKQVDGLKSTRGKVALDRGDHVAQTNPYEGEVMVNYLSDKPYHYARGAWHPFGGGEMPWARIVRQFADSNQSIGNNSFVEINCTASYNVGAGESGNGVFTVDLTDNTITVVNAGVVMVRALANWFDAITNAWIVWVSNSEVSNQNHRRAGGGISTTMQDELMFLTRVPAGTSFTPGVWQIDGAARNLDFGFLEVSYMGTYTGTDFSAMDPDIA